MSSYFKILLLPISFLLFFQMSYAQFSDGRLIMQGKGNMNSPLQGDLNGDGSSDIVASGAAGVWYYFGDENGIFGPEQTLMISNGSRVLISLLDVDQDNDLDILTSNFLCKVCYYKNDGLGNFLGPIPIDTSDEDPLNLVVADLDSDGDQDIITSYQGDLDKIDWIENLGAGVFSERETLLANIRASKFLVADVQGDGHLDILVNDAAVNNNTVWFSGDGTGNFDTAQIVSENYPGFTNLVLFDLNNDGRQDVITGINGPPGIVWYEADSLGGFLPEKYIGDPIPNVYDIAIHDFNNDGFPDVLHSSYFSDNIGIFLADTFGIYSAENTISTSFFNYSELLVDDFNLDANLDFFFVAHGTVGQMTGLGNGSFQLEQILSDENPNAIGDIVSGDIDNDGGQDVLIGYLNYTSDISNNLVNLKNHTAQNRFIPELVANASSRSDQIALSDINNDGQLDLINLSRGVPGFVEWSLGGGDGTFTRQDTFLTIENPVFLKVIDLNADGYKDIVVNAENTLNLVWGPGDGNGNFGPFLEIETSSLVGSFAIGDFDNDEDLDIMTASREGDNVQFYINDGTANFTEILTIAENVNDPSDIIAKDMDGDGDLDILVRQVNDKQVNWFENQGNNAFAGPVSLVEFVNSPLDFKAEDLDNDGLPEVIIPGTQEGRIRILKNIGGGNFENWLDLTGINVPRQLEIVDIDNDGDKDIICTSSGSNGQSQPVHLFENLSPEGILNFSVNSTEFLPCSDNNNGDIQIVASGGQPPYTINWTDNSLNGFYINGLSSGDYSFTLSDNNGTNLLETVMILAPDALEITSISNPVSTVGQNDGSIEVTPIGGTPPFQYEWSNGQMDSLITNLVPATYTVTITDANDCSIMEDITVDFVSATTDLCPAMDLLLFPNPVKPFTSFELKSNCPVLPAKSFQLVSLLGQIVTDEHEIIQEGNKIKGWISQPGFYYLRIHLSNTKTLVQKILVLE